jgi:hypothetical protein
VSNILFCHNTLTNTILQHSRLPGVGLYSLLGTHTTDIPSRQQRLQRKFSRPQRCSNSRHTAHDNARHAPTQPIQRSLRTRLLHLTPSEQQLVGNHFTMPQCEAAFLKDMIDGKVHSGGTDGSAKPLQASHSWILQSSWSGDFMSSHASKNTPCKSATLI